MPTGDEADISVNVSANTIMFMKDIRQVGYAMEHLASTMRSAGFAMSAAVTAPIVGIGTAAVVAAGKMESMQVAFEGLLGSSEAANKQMAWMKEFAKTTPFRFEDITKATQGFLAYGFSVEESNQMMIRLTDAVAAFGGSPEMINSVTRALGQMHGRQRVTAQEMTQLTETGLNAWQMLADYLNVDVKTAMEMVTAKEVDATKGIAAIMEGMADPKYAGAAARQMETLNGIISNVQDSIQFLLADIGEAFLPMLKTLATDYVLPLIDKIGILADKFSKLPVNIQLATVAIAGLAAAIGPALLILSTMFQMVGGGIAGGSVIYTALKTGLGRGSAAGIAGVAAGKAAGGLGRTAALTGLTELAAEGMGVGTAGMLAGGGAGAGAVGAGAGGAAAGGGLLSTITGLLPIIAIIAAIVVAVGSLVAIFKSAYDQSEALRQAVASLFMGLEDLGKVIIDTIFPGTKDVSSLWDKLVKIVTDVRKAFDDFGKSTAPMWVGIIDVVRKFVKLITDNFPAIWKAISDVAAIIYGSLISAITYLYNLFKPLIDAVVDFALDLINMLIPALTDLYNDVVPILIDVLGDLWKVIESVWKVIEVSMLPSLRAIAEIVVALATLFVQIFGPIIIGIIREVIDTVKALAKIILDVLGFVCDFLTGDFSGAWEHVKSIIRTVVEWIQNTGDNIFNTVYHIGVSIGNNIYDFFARIYNTITSNFLNPLIDKANALDRTFNGGKNQLDYFGHANTTAEQWVADNEAMQASWDDAYGGGTPVSSTANTPTYTPSWGYDTAGSFAYHVGRASGGFVGAGMPYTVGEKGPELFVPNTNGYIVPNGGSQGVTVIIEMDSKEIARKTAPATANLIRMRQGLI
jgi:tape measure domain-containing protein